MNIIAGIYKGKKIKVPAGQLTRPTLGRVKESLFNILDHYLTGDFLELYAGSGSIGLEALSRGCRHVTLVETNRAAIRCIQATIAQLEDASDHVLLVQQSAIDFCQQTVGHKLFDYIFLDPPYQQIYYDFWNQRFNLSQLLAPKGQLIVQHGPAIDCPAVWSGAVWKQTRQYGNTKLSFYSNDEAKHES